MGRKRGRGRGPARGPKRNAAAEGGAAKASGGGKAKGKGSSKNITITLLDEGGVDINPELSRSDGVKVRWDNQAQRGLTLTFTFWPFIEPKTTIEVPKKKKTKWFTVFAETTIRSYGYSIDPDLSKDQPPDPPSLDVGG